MKKSLIYFSALILGLIGSTALTSCDNDWEYPPMVVPEATIEANTTIADLKSEFFQSGQSNYATLVGTKADGSHYIIEGYVSTSDESGNYFKQLVIQDATSAIQLDVDAYDLYLSYQVGQKIVLDVTGLYIGGYGGLLQIGAAPTSGYPARIAEDTFKQHAQIDGLSNESTLVQPLTVSMGTLNSVAPLTADGLQLQNRLIRIEGVTFQNAGKQTLSTSGSNGVSQTFSNSEGSAILYTSGYSDFWDYYCPTGTGNIIGILSCYRDAWQIRLISIDGLQGFDELVKEPGQGNTPGGDDNPGDTPGGNVSGTGTQDNPYSVAAVMNGATGSDVWVKGYIVGWVEGQVLTDGAHFNATNVSVASNILIADSPNATSLDNAIPVQLPAESVRAALNLQNNPGNLGKEVLLKGSLEKYFGVAGLKNVSEYVMDGAGGDSGESGTIEKYTVAQALSMITSGNYSPSATVQVEGYIKSITEVSTTYGNATYIITDSMNDANGLTVFRGYYLDGAKFTSEDQIKVGAKVIVEGTLTYYNNTTPEMTTGNKIVSYIAP